MRDTSQVIDPIWMTRIGEEHLTQSRRHHVVGVSFAGRQTKRGAIHRMVVGDLVRINSGHDPGEPPLQHRRRGLFGVILRDHSPMRPPDVGRVFDVMWNNGEIEDMYSDDLEIVR